MTRVPGGGKDDTCDHGLLSRSWKAKMNTITAVVTLRRMMAYFVPVYGSGSMRPLCCDQPETRPGLLLARQASGTINGAPRRKRVGTP